MNELALKPANNAIFRVKFVCIEEAQKYYMMVLNILCMTYFVPSSFTELQTAIWVKYVQMIKSSFKIWK